MRRSLSIPLLLLGLMLLWALNSPRQTLLPEQPAAVATDERIPDSYAAGVRALEFDADGTLISETTAAGLQRFRGENLVEMTDLARVNHRDGQRWIANADRGDLREANDILELRGQVTLRYPDEDVRFGTEALTINFAKDSARSLAPASITRGNDYTRGDQLYVTLSSRRATLTGAVESVYAPPR